MSEKKPTPIIIEPQSKMCPVCGKRSYSREGVHPQCAVSQADEPRRIRIVAEKKAIEKQRIEDRVD
ncbi:MAG: hypothetical protein WD070_03560 [Pirellulaceae bacterium]